MAKKDASFVHLHTHTDKSILDGTESIDGLVEKAKANNMPGFAVTDHGNLYALPELLKKQDSAKAAGVKMIMGCEFYMSEDRTKKDKDQETYHITILAKDNKGLENISLLSTKSYTEGFYRKPRIDLNLLSEHKDGLIVLSGCLGGQVAQALKNNDKKQALELIGSYQDIMGKDNYFLEVMPLEIQEQKDVNNALTQMSKDFKIPTVTTCDCHYLEKSHFKAHDTWLAIQTGSVMSDPNRFRFTTNRAYFQTPEEVLQNSLDAGLTQESMYKTLDVLEMISDYSIDRSLKMPTIPNTKERLVKESFAGLEKKGLLNNPTYMQRLNYELDIINTLDFDSYFILVQKIVRMAKTNDIPVGPGRGSAAGSLVCWALGITDIDPIKNGLIFERFLNPARISPPDIDLDIGTIRRNDVIKMIAAEYGSDKVATIGTFGAGSTGGKMILKRVMSAYEVPFSTANMATKNMQQLTDFEPKTDKEKEMLEIAKVLLGVPASVGAHAAGVVVSNESLIGKYPLQTSKIASENGILQLQFDMSAVDYFGLIKIDVLGLKELDILKDLEKRTGQNPSPDIFTKDIDTMKMISKGETTGVFQLGTSDGMKNMVSKMKCDSFSDVCAALSLFRPGPLESGIVDRYIENKKIVKSGKKPPSLHPKLDELLMETYGVPIYQEQIMEMGKILAGFDMKEADLLRKAMGKKKPEEMAKMKEKWVSGCSLNNISEKDAKDLFDKVEHFSGYGFNKSHSAAYAITAMKMAWYKCHFPEQYWASKISHEKDIESRGEMSEAAKREGVNIVAPTILCEDINKKYSDICEVFEENGSKKIMLGLADLKGVSEGIADKLNEDLLKNGKFTTMADVYERLIKKKDDNPPILNKRALVSLTSVGFFDGLHKNRKDILDWVESKYTKADGIPGLESTKKKRSQKTSKKIGMLFPDFNDGHDINYEKNTEIKKLDKKNVDNDNLSKELYASGTVISNNETEIRKTLDHIFGENKSDICSCEKDLIKNVGNKEVSLVGVLKQTKKLTSTKGNTFYMSQLILPSDSYQVTLFIWEDVWGSLEKSFKENQNKIVAIKGKLQEGKDGKNYTLSVQDLWTKNDNNKEILNNQEYQLEVFDSEQNKQKAHVLSYREI